MLQGSGDGGTGAEPLAGDHQREEGAHTLLTSFDTRVQMESLTPAQAQV